ncbi:serine hydrolase [Alkalihalobacillus sp. AL-G]|uniref:serine hydrolase domain-containing protein n=1 Tax=Alkalihalobacillus sp. AL-G TaxID=2926399 RepID=UPI00272A72C6|nr:serine hydrolase domain-containing protein [Alkalihalobacillus sp. AL-G]WLD91926.1 beta-lactamase family protein [Alkalihalobacillus sp. AL-G]
MNLTDSLNEIVEHAVASIVPGIAIQVVQDGDLIYENTSGHRTTFPSTQPVTVDTRFDLASLTKIVTSTMILILVSQSRLSLNTKIDTFFKPCLTSRMNERFSGISVKKLLTHTSGFPAWHPFYCSNKSFLAQIDELIPMFSLDRKVCYSDLNFILLGKIIEQITGMSLQDAFRDLIKIPVSLTSMEYGPVSEENVAATEFGNRIEMGMCNDRNKTFSDWRDIDEPIKGEVNDGNTHYFFQGVSGHAGLFSTMKDVSKFAQIYTDPTLAETVGLDCNLIEMACREHVPGRGLGWEVSPIFMNRADHTGFTGTSICVDPTERVVVTLMTSRLHQEHPANLTSLREKVHEIVFRFLHNA